MKRLLIILSVTIGILAMLGSVNATTINLSAQTILDTLKSLEGANAFSNDGYYYGIDKVFVKPGVSSGASVQYNSGSTIGATIADWSKSAASSNYTGYFEFDGSAWNIPQNMITDVNPANIQQQLSGQNIGQVASNAVFTVEFTVTGGDYLNNFYFVVDGYKFSKTDASLEPISFSGGGLAGQRGFANNAPPGYQVNGSAVPIPAAVVLMGSGLLGLIGFGWRFRGK